MKVKETLISSIYNHSLLYTKFERRHTTLNHIIYYKLCKQYNRYTLYDI